jgi:predicted TIM-barrel fold metal-dependent hydrolase
MPFDSAGGKTYIRLALEAIDASGLAPEEKRAVLEGNARALLGLGEPG